MTYHDAGSTSSLPASGRGAPVAWGGIVHIKKIFGLILSDQGWISFETKMTYPDRNNTKRPVCF